MRGTLGLTPLTPSGEKHKAPGKARTLLALNRRVN